jgi:hypothetical protein
MTYQLTVDYDERDFLEIWIPEFNSDPFPELEPGLYEMFSSAKLKGADYAFDSIMIDAFSTAYPRVLAEVKRKEPPIERENYDVPELGLYRVQLSRILEEIYCRFAAKKELSLQETEVFAA